MSMLIDFVLASAHHILIFVLMGSLAGEAVLLRLMPGKDVFGTLSKLDAVYGASAGLVIAIGICRVLFGLKGWEFYVASHAFWTKMALFAAVGLLSIAPTRRFGVWRKQAVGNPSFQVAGDELAGVRRFVTLELLLLLLIPVVAAAMARDIG